MSEYPFYVENRNKRYTFYGVLVTDFEDIEEIWDGEIAERLYGYTNNEWEFNGYLKFYSNYFNRCKYIIFEYEDLTHDEFIKIVYEDHGVKFDTGDYIDMDIIKLTGDVIFNNSGLYEIMSEYCPESNEIERTFIPSIMKAYELFNKCNYFKESFDIVNKLLFRLANIYVPCVILSSYIPCDLEEYKDKDMLMYLTKIADFPMPIEEYEYYELISSAYEFKYFLVENLNYRVGEYE